MTTLRFDELEPVFTPQFPKALTIELPESVDIRNVYTVKEVRRAANGFNADKLSVMNVSNSDVLRIYTINDCFYLPPLVVNSDFALYDVWVIESDGCLKPLQSVRNWMQKLCQMNHQSASINPFVSRTFRDFNKNFHTLIQNFVVKIDKEFFINSQWKFGCKIDAEEFFLACEEVSKILPQFQRESVQTQGLFFSEILDVLSIRSSVAVGHLLADFAELILTKGCASAWYGTNGPVPRPEPKF